MRRMIAFFLAAVMFFGNADWSVLQVAATEQEEMTVPEEKTTDDKIIMEEGWEVLSPMETSAISMSMFSITDGQVPLKSTNEVKWIDRLDLSDAECIRELYDSLVEAVDNDGLNDYLIDDSYFTDGYSLRVVTEYYDSSDDLGNKAYELYCN